ncbi:acetyl-CoA carboxylase biotin carboxylase subunit [Pampinifervens florentissimum]|uniref:acetyl-CoA carboxylase biotin carboxylase subunit n=1 Tax=Pampinifervens florentissimum TaxID=1632019 RepID=UPI0013B490C6|nr:acetyl-CoA carboxylase biotin carboxylase subunit [Hydrogenobacter sp. T-8]QID33966.1 acetyl-CoA carboxylase biotin carboxylase subunit [Hydrogenobacter sp. T-8]
MFNKVLVANRGEIACRVIRACKELGIRTVAIYNEIESTARHVKMADEAYMIGVNPLDTYLNAERIVDLALEVGADAIHPGYGFLAENEHFARLCEEKGINFIGPHWKVIELMGDKARSKEIAKKAGLPTVPGSDGILKDEQEAKQIAREIGYPVLLKASAGGGGRGIRICRNEEELLKNYESAYNEALKAFGRGDLLLEKYIENPHHIEFQVLGDKYGNVIHLGERDCSIQRRNQKLVEIAPSLLLTPGKRAYYGELVAQAAKEIGYYSAGTMEFVADEKGNIYFIEMNTRIQVEHPVTEMITGVDIVKWQLRIAAGEPLRYKQEDIKFNGYSIEVRINAEDPKKNFAPSIGTIERYYAPGGFGIRVEHAASRGYEISPYYDSMIAKLIVWAPQWEVAVDRMKAALETYEITGIKTTIPLLIEIMKDPDFRAGKFNTKYLETHPHLFEYEEVRNKEDFVAFISAAIAAYHGL